MSFILWRAVKGKLPVDETIGKFRKNMVSKCLCCRNPKNETISQIFLTSDIAFLTWNFLGIQSNAYSMHKPFKTGGTTTKTQ